MSLTAAVEAVSLLDISVSVLLRKSDSIYVHSIRVSFPDIGSGVVLLFGSVCPVRPGSDGSCFLPLVFEVGGFLIPSLDGVWDSVHPIDSVYQRGFQPSGEELDQGMLVLDCASVCVGSKFGDVFLNHSLLGQGSQLGNSGASGVYRHKGFLEFLFKIVPCPEARGILGKSLLVVVHSPGLSYSFLHMREAESNSLLVIVDKQVCFDRH